MRVSVLELCGSLLLLVVTMVWGFGDLLGLSLLSGLMLGVTGISVIATFFVMHKKRQLSREAEEQQRKLESIVNTKELESRKVTIARPPGMRLMNVVEVLVSPERYERVFQPILADWHEEFFQALSQNRGRGKLLAIRIRHTWGFLKALGLLSLLQAIGALVIKIKGSGDK